MGIKLTGRSSVSWATHACERISEDEDDHVEDDNYRVAWRTIRLLIIAIHHRVWCYEAVFKDPEEKLCPQMAVALLLGERESPRGRDRIGTRFFFNFRLQC